MIKKISETEFGYVFQNEQISLKISKKTWEQARHSKPGEVLNDGIATVIFYKTTGGTRIQKTFKDKKITMVVDDITWRYMWSWTLHPEKRKELTEEYIKNMSPEEIKKRNIARFTAQFETPEYKASMEKRRIEYEKKWAEECKQSRIFAQEKEKARQEMIEKIHNDIMSGACELPFYEG